MTFIPEEEYQKIIKKMPVFCADFLIYAEKKYLLVKRKEEPIKDVYWVIGGRLRYKETMKELAERVVEVCESGEANFQPLYKDELSLIEKIKCVATEIYRASDISADKKILDQLKDWEKAGYGNLPVCMAKTQYSFSADPNSLGAPEGHVIPIREVRLSAGAGFIVAICGDIMTMPGLPSLPAAEKIHIDDDNLVQGLF